MGNLCGRPEVPAGTYVVQQRLNDLEAIERGLAPPKTAAAAPHEEHSIPPQQLSSTAQQQQDSAPLKAAAAAPPLPSAGAGGGGSYPNSAASNTIQNSGSRPSFTAPTDQISDTLQAAHLELKNNSTRNFEDYYVLDKVIGHGAFAKVSICTSRSGQKQFAVKAVQKNHEDTTGKQREGVVKEIAIMRTLQDHPNTVKLMEVFEDAESYMLVMELCTGGELFDQIIQKGHFSEKDAADKMRCLLDFIAFAHSRNIIHRDLKPENILLSDKTPSSTIKVIDFGTSDFCLSGQRLSQKFGTPYYVAPEVLKKNYDKSIDIWSAGVIMYILLCGYPPFGGKTDAKILQRVQAGVYSFEGREWEVVTEAAKDMITLMLVMDITDRASAKQLLQHRWFQVAATAPAAALGAHMVKRLRAFAGMSKMKRLALVVLARTLTDNDVKRLRELFAAMDTNNDGRIDSQDLHNALEKVGAAIDESEMQDLFHASDIDGTGQIDYEQFIAAMLDSNRVARRKEAVRKSFEQLDRDGDGYITAADLVRVMPRGSSIEVAREMVSEVDKKGEGRVDYAEFHKMMQA
ncbi:kinase-like domain-containing protein [Dunaliella salina]|uniref:Kinase-like domain-containing protein n=1 Tax=Dunaliella salina TaxID=3046 RepID=A0ABQ7GQE2_DUNSA|nr:kinase-like domain-containing protein [Dunaliella salina]|eukprot:KAF5836831.1 kinase-like domain-containing protein [Dunaliella salina]